MQFFTRMICLTGIAAGLMAATAPVADAQYPMYSVPVQPVAPAVVGYSAQRRGLFGRRVVFRPVVAPVAVAPVAAVAPAPVAVARPVVEAPVTSYYAPPVAVARPVVAAPVTSYYAPAVPVAVPVRTYYRAPIRTYRVPVWGF